ncbi:uncharacterized protein LOC143259497 [Megalopta genalis]|uniref:uncharacterized protein LOC143259497 n=1 Tax=Megalopta genalis TaxID=115081 RepID=UPI003FCF0F0B
MQTRANARNDSFRSECQGPIGCLLPARPRTRFIKMLMTKIVIPFVPSDCASNRVEIVEMTPLTPRCGGAYPPNTRDEVILWKVAEKFNHPVTNRRKIQPSSDKSSKNSTIQRE